VVNVISNQVNWETTGDPTRGRLRGGAKTLITSEASYVVGSGLLVGNPK